MELKNQWLKAEVDAATGNLLGISNPSGDVLVSACGCTYRRDGRIFGERSDAGGERFQYDGVRATAGRWESRAFTDDIEVHRSFELSPVAPLLSIRCTVRARRPGVVLERPIALPGIVFGSGFLNPFDDEEDLYFDGAELGDGRELPPWRVFFRQGHDTGVIAAARSKRAMSHLHVLDDGFAMKPHILAAYTTDFKRTQSAMVFAERDTVYTVEFEIGPWSREEHERILEAARLNVPADRLNSPMTGEPPSPPAGIVHRAIDFADAAAVGDRYDPRKWMRAAMPNCLGGRALFCGNGVKAPPVSLAPGLTGLFRVFVGIGNGNGVEARFSADPMPIFRLPREKTASEDAFPDINPFILRLSGPARHREVFLKTARMDGQTLTLSRLANSYAATVLDYVRFEPLTAAEAADWEREERAEPVVELSGFNDMPDIAWMTDPLAPDAAAYEANLWAHAESKIRKVYWRIDGQCSDFHSRLNTRRYVCARVHHQFTPQLKAYGRTLRQTDLLRLAVDAARKYGLTLYGWMRFNNYSGNVQSDFFVKHPEYHETNDRGVPLKKLCLAHEAVRRHKIGILCEAAAYGLDGINLGFLRHPPVLHYAPVLVEGFRARHGVPPPPEPDKATAEHVQTHPEEDELRLAWYRYRAGYLTTFGRELRAALRAQGLDNVKVAIWVRHDRCLYDGIDIDAWLDEGLCDEVVAAGSGHIYGPACTASAEWRAKVRSRALLIDCISAYDIEGARRLAAEAMRAGCDGLCTYESDFAVADEEFVEFYRCLRSGGAVVSGERQDAGG